MSVRVEDRNWLPGRDSSVTSCAPETFFVALSPVNIDSAQKTSLYETSSSLEFVLANSDTSETFNLQEILILNLC